MFNYLHDRPQSRSLRTNKNLTRPLIRQIDRQQAEKCFNLGKQHQNKSQITLAKQLYIQSTIHDPNYFQAYCNLGTCLRKQLKFEQAIQSYLRAKSIKNDDTITIYNLANVYRIIGDQQKAVELYNLVIMLKQKNNINIGNLYIDSIINLGVCYKNTGNYDKAIESYQKVRKSNPNEFSILFNQSICYLRLLRNINKKREQCLMLIQQTVRKTQMLFDQILTKQPHNQVIQIANIQLKYIKNPTQQVLEKCIEQFDFLGLNKNITLFQKQQIAKQKAFCLNLLKRYKQSANQYKRAQLNKKIKQQKLKQQQKITIKQNITNINKYNINEQENYYEKEEDIQTGLNKETWVLPVKPTITVYQNEFNNQFHDLLHKLLLLVNESFYDKSFQLIQRDAKDKYIKNQALIILYSIMSERQINRQFAELAFNIYKDYFLIGDINKQIKKQIFQIQTHRAIASVLTILGFSQKAIEHYQIISQIYKKQNLQQKDSLQQLYSGLATNYESQGLYIKAIQQFKKALNLNPNDFVLQFNLAYSQQLAGEMQDSIDSYSIFLQLIQKQQNIDKNTKNSFIIQGYINRFVCGQQQNKLLLKQGELIQEKIQQFYGKQNSQIIQKIDVNILMSFWLKLADVYQQLISSQIRGKGTGSDQMKTKLYKQKLFATYLCLLQLPNCPDKQAILTNCGNILFQQKQYINALNFYCRLNEKIYHALNNVSLIYFNLHEHSNAMIYLEQARKIDPKNKISKINQDIYKWVYNYYFGTQRQIQEQRSTNIMYKKFNCICENKFYYRLQYGKSLIQKLTNQLSYNLQQNDQSNNILYMQNYQIFFEDLLQQNQKDQNWLDPQSKRKHQFLYRNLNMHCNKQNHNKIIQVPQHIMSKILLIIKKQLNQLNKLQQLFKQLINEFKIISLKYINDESVIKTLLNLFIYFHSSSQDKQQKLTDCIQKQINFDNQSLVYHLIVKDQYTQRSLFNSSQYINKNFDLIYPSVQLKIKNLMQTLIVWQSDFEDHLKYLFKIVQSLGYKRQLQHPMIIQYNFPHCKLSAQNCQQCFIKTYKILTKIQNINTLKQFDIKLDQPKTLLQSKNILLKQLDNKFPSVLQKILAQKNQDNLMSLYLSQNLLPIEITLHFVNYNCCIQYINELCIQINSKPLKIDKPKNYQIKIILNRLLKVKCKWSQPDIIKNALIQLIQSPFGIRAQSIIKLDYDISFLWKQNHENQQLLRPYIHLLKKEQLQKGQK